MRPFFVLFILPLAAGIASAAEPEPVTTLAPLTVTEHPSGADERTAAIWVVTRDPALAPARHVRDLLNSVPGLHLNQPGGPGGRSSLWVRGAEDNYAIVYLDNIPLNDPTSSTGGAVDFSLVDPGLIQSAAVVRGPSSVRYGAEALAGVVHLGTGAPEETFRQFDLEAGGADLRPWTWLLEATIALEGGATQQSTQLNLYLDAYAGGTELLVGVPELNLVVAAEPGLIDALRPLLLERPDPGVPPPAETPATPAPAVTPPAPAG